jgi:hypothetical protein
MTNANQSGNQNGKIQTTLDELLVDRSDKFKATVLELALKNKWDDNDPAFTILVATGQMEALLQQYPAEFAVLLTGILEETEKKWAVIQTKNSQHFEQLESAANKQIVRLELESKKLLAQGFKLAQNEAAQHIKSAQKIQTLHAVGWAIAATIALISLSWCAGWFGRSWLERSSTWGDIERWNQAQLQACVDTQRKTCNFHIKVPESD